ncbi:hypothetical protein D3C87_1055110 [compost metagenome]
MQTEGAQLTERAMRRNLLQPMLVPVVDLDQALDLHAVLALFAQNLGHHGFQTFIPLNQRAVAIEGQPFGARSVFKGHREIL